MLTLMGKNRPNVDCRIVAQLVVRHHQEKSVVDWVFMQGDSGVVLLELSYLDLAVAGKRVTDLIFEKIEKNPFTFEDMQEICQHRPEESINFM